MLRGMTKIELNEATVVEAVQHYFTTRVFAEGKVPVVKTISYDAGKGYDSTPRFIVEVLEAPRDDAAKPA